MTEKTASNQINNIDDERAKGSVTTILQQPSEPYQSIVPLKGTLVNSHILDGLSQSIEEYWREIDETVETD